MVTIEHPRPGAGENAWSQSTFSPLDDGTVFVVSRDISERKQAEEALRHNIRQEELIRAQALALAELSTPLIPLNRDVVVMPLAVLAFGYAISRLATKGDPADTRHGPAE